MRTATRRIATGAVLACAGVLVLASAAQADTRYADVAFDNSDPSCPQSKPCDIHRAVDFAAAGDTVIVNPGSYNVLNTSVVVNNTITVRGAPGGPRPEIVATDASAILNFGGAGTVIEDLRLESTAAAGSYTLNSQGGAILQRLEIVASGTTPFGALVRQGALLRDSFVHNTNSNTTGIATGGTGAHLRNVTVFATGASAIGVSVAAGFGDPQDVTIRNAIIDAGDGITGHDIRAFGDDNAGNGVVEVNVSYSSLDSTDTIFPADAQITFGAGNQDATATPPMLVDAAGGDFHELAGSPTRDMGSPDAMTGPLDFDREPRTMGTALDIGGDEFTDAIPQPPTQPVAFPSNFFNFGKLKRKKKKGIAFVIAFVPGPGQVGLAGKGIKNRGLASTARKSVFTPGGRVKLKVKPKKKGKKGKRILRRLRKKGKAKVKVRVSYLPTGGTINTRSRKVKLVRR